MAVQVESQLCLKTGLPLKMNDTGQPHYPLHDSVKSRLHKQYVDFYDKYLINAQPSHLQPIAVSRRNNVVFGGSPLLPVGRTLDFVISRQATPGPSVRARCFVPNGEVPHSGWPVMLYIHGGGWVLGDIDSENHICTNLCARSRCVVITPEYRLAPEDPFPAGLDDCWETLLWINTSGSGVFQIDATRIAIGGSSSGANLAAAVVNKSLRSDARLKIVAQLLVVPVLDNTACPDNNASWKQNEFTAALPAAKMIWYRNHYLPNPQDRSHPDASPLLFVSSALSEKAQPSISSPHNSAQWNLITAMPPTTIIAASVCILKQEAEDYGEMLRKAGVPACVHVIEGMPHPFVALDNVLDSGKQAMTLLCDALRKAVSQ